MAKHTNKPNQPLRRFYQQGKQMAEMRKKWRSMYKVFKQLKEPSRAAKNRQMEAHRFYNLYKGRLNWICSLGKDEGKPLTRSHVTLLLRVKDKDRDRLAKQCADQGWNVKRLEWEVRKHESHAYGGSRSYKLAGSAEDVLLVAVQLLSKLVGWIESLPAQEQEIHRLGGSFPLTLKENGEARQELEKMLTRATDAKKSCIMSLKRLEEPSAKPKKKGSSGSLKRRSRRRSTKASAKNKRR